MASYATVEDWYLQVLEKITQAAVAGKYFLKNVCAV